MINSIRDARERLLEHGLRWMVEFYFYRIFRSKQNLLRFAFRIGFFRKTPPVLDGLEPLHIPTYVGISHTVHPTLTTYQGRLFLSVTPYPFRDCYHENPCIYHSSDGIRFTALSSCFPFSKRNGGYGNYLSDPNLSTSKNNELVIRYRETINHVNSAPETLIWESSTSDLKNWSAPREVLSRRDASVISPASRHIENQEWIYFVSLVNEVGEIYRSLADNLHGLPLDRIGVDGIPEGCHPWHLDFFSAGASDFMLLTTATDGQGSATRLFLCRQTDTAGLRFAIKKEICPDLSEDKKPVFIYKAAGLPTSDNSAHIYLSLIFPSMAVITYRHHLALN